MDIDTLIDHIKATSHCIVHDPTGIPAIRKNDTFPDDLKRFYSLCGGIDLFTEGLYPIRIIPPTQFVLANPVIVGGLVEDDMSSSSYIIGDDTNGDYLTIDLDKERLGRCYNSFSDCHGIPGSSPIIAASFTDFLFRLYENKGQYWYWLRSDFIPIGDAYSD